MRLNIKQTAEYLNCSVSMVRKLTTIGELKVIKIGAKCVYDKVDIDAYIESRKQGGIE